MSDISSAGVHVQNTPADFNLAQRFLYRERREPWRTLLWLLPGAIAAVAIFNILANYPHLIFAMAGNLPAMLPGIPEEVTPVIAMVAAIITFLASVNIAKKFRVKSELDPEGSFLSPVDICLCDDGVRWSNHRGEGRTAWHAVLRIEQTATHIFIFIDRASAHIIPRHSFASDAAASAFVSVARNYISGSRATAS